MYITYTKGLEEIIDGGNVVSDERVEDGHVVFVEHTTIDQIL